MRTFAHNKVLCSLLLCSGVLAAMIANRCSADEPSKCDPPSRPVENALSFELQARTLRILLNKQPLAEYVFQDDEILRPYFRDVRTTSGIQVTRNHPPVAGQDPVDHAQMHPGLWLAFGELGGGDFWRNKGRVRQLRFSGEPEGTESGGSFAVENAFELGERTICTETFRCTITWHELGYLMDWSSTFRAEQDFDFGDQEEMGLGVRVATPLTVDRGGEIVDSEGRKNGGQVWGKQADWCQYGGVIDRQKIGVVVMPDPTNFRRAWFHARDYGLLVANPFGANAFTKKEKSSVVVPAGKEFRLNFTVLVYGVAENVSPDMGGLFLEHFKK